MSSKDLHNNLQIATPDRIVIGVFSYWNIVFVWDFITLTAHFTEKLLIFKGLALKTVRRSDFQQSCCLSYFAALTLCFILIYSENSLRYRIQSGLFMYFVKFKDWKCFVNVGSLVNIIITELPDMKNEKWFSLLRFAHLGPGYCKENGAFKAFCWRKKTLFLSY